MNPTKLVPGLYRLMWREGGGESLAAVGVLFDGTHWYAPVNWTCPSDHPGGVVSTDWAVVESAVRLFLAGEESDRSFVEPKRGMFFVYHEDADVPSKTDVRMGDTEAEVVAWIKANHQEYDTIRVFEGRELEVITEVQVRLQPRFPEGR